MMPDPIARRAAITNGEQTKEAPTSYVVGIDIGGTFTDTVVIDGEGTVASYKTPTTPAALLEGLETNLREAAGARASTPSWARSSGSPTGRPRPPTRSSSGEALARRC